MIYIFSSKNEAALRRALVSNKKTDWFEILPQISARQKFAATDQAYLDISGLTPGELKTALGLLKKSFVCWGIIDPKGTTEDPALYFFSGAIDYIGPLLVKAGLDKKRFAAALSWSTGRGAEKNSTKKTEDAGKKKGKTLPAGKFGGWKAIRSGTTNPFFFLFVSLSGKSDIRSMVGEAAFVGIKNRLRETLQQYLREADALLWMETEETSLFLVPPTVEKGRAVIEAALKIILNSRLIGMEKLLLPIQVDFTIAMHYGQTAYQTPGKTGAVISESVNYIFHLGAKKAEPGQLVISDDVPEEVIPNGLLDLFSSAGEYEGVPIRCSKRFVYE
ncbi:MAG: hypothetical protein FWC36_03355 [Spirochaetes bacterium]|nr:hypothetical protein [Spirochaetota bacterium]